PVHTARSAPAAPPTPSARTATGSEAPPRCPSPARAPPRSRRLTTPPTPPSIRPAVVRPSHPLATINAGTSPRHATGTRGDAVLRGNDSSIRRRGGWQAERE